ncbi:MAG: hypothetical protein M3Y22_06445 [Pseudomonadota bacterium]|nr:hypothetical protein [Pseudomonadota bacterium]
MARPVERWLYLGRGEIEGQIVSYSIDDTWPKTTNTMRTSHWQIVYDDVQPNGSKEFRFVDKVDCDRERRAAMVVERYSKTGQLLHRKVITTADLSWESIANDSLEAKADGFACIYELPPK